MVRSFECRECIDNDLQTVLKCDMCGPANARCTCVCLRHCLTGNKLNFVLLRNKTCEIHGKQLI